MIDTKVERVCFLAPTLIEVRQLYRNVSALYPDADVRGFPMFQFRPSILAWPFDVIHISRHKDLVASVTQMRHFSSWVDTSEQMGARIVLGSEEGT